MFKLTKEKRRNGQVINEVQAEYEKLRDVSNQDRELVMNAVWCLNELRGKAAWLARDMTELVAKIDSISEEGATWEDLKKIGFYENDSGGSLHDDVVKSLLRFTTFLRIASPGF